MCQQWLSVVGLLCDLIGFLLIAWEWYRVFVHDVERRYQEIQYQYERSLLAEEGKPVAYEPDMETMLMAKEFSKLHAKESAFRQWLFFAGAGLIVLGFLLQLLGSLPMPFLIFTNC